MPFDQQKRGWIYVIVDRETGNRKVGITNKLEHRLDQFGRTWEIRYASRHDGHVVAAIENIVIMSLVKKYKTTQMSRTEFASGFTETFVGSKPKLSRIVKLIKRTEKNLLNL